MTTRAYVSSPDGIADGQSRSAILRAIITLIYSEQGS